MHPPTNKTNSQKEVKREIKKYFDKMKIKT